jgi:uncharacterized protein (TIGR01741 family)
MNGFYKHLIIKGGKEMTIESKLNPYYSDIANKLDRIVPVEWHEIVMYAEELGDVRTAHFYYTIIKGGEYKHSGKIPDDYGVDTKIYFRLIKELSEIVNKMWLEFVSAGEEKWTTVTFRLDNEYKFKIRYGYEINREIGSYERGVCWAYEELGIIPEDDFKKKIVEEYLEDKKNNS